jgi:hypothetical protein
VDVDHNDNNGDVDDNAKTLCLFSTAPLETGTIIDEHFGGHLLATDLVSKVPAKHRSLLFKIHTYEGADSRDPSLEPLTQTLDTLGRYVVSHFYVYAHHYRTYGALLRSTDDPRVDNVALKLTGSTLQLAVTRAIGKNTPLCLPALSNLSPIASEASITEEPWWSQCALVDPNSSLFFAPVCLTPSSLPLAGTASFPDLAFGRYIYQTPSRPWAVNHSTLMALVPQVSNLTALESICAREIDFAAQRHKIWQTQKHFNALHDMKMDNWTPASTPYPCLVDSVFGSAFLSSSFEPTWMLIEGCLGARRPTLSGFNVPSNDDQDRLTASFPVQQPSPCKGHDCNNRACLWDAHYCRRCILEIFGFDITHRPSTDNFPTSDTAAALNPLNLCDFQLWTRRAHSVGDVLCESVAGEWYEAPGSIGNNKSAQCPGPFAVLVARPVAPVMIQRVRRKEPHQCLYFTGARRRSFPWYARRTPNYDQANVELVVALDQATKQVVVKAVATRPICPQNGWAQLFMYCRASKHDPKNAGDKPIPGTQEATTPTSLEAQQGPTTNIGSIWLLSQRPFEGPGGTLEIPKIPDNDLLVNSSNPMAIQVVEKYISNNPQNYIHQAFAKDMRILYYRLTGKVKAGPNERDVRTYTFETLLDASRKVPALGWAIVYMLEFRFFKHLLSTIAVQINIVCAATFRHFWIAQTGFPAWNATRNTFAAWNKAKLEDFKVAPATGEVSNYLQTRLWRSTALEQVRCAAFIGRVDRPLLYTVAGLCALGCESSKLMPLYLGGYRKKYLTNRVRLGNLNSQENWLCEIHAVARKRLEWYMSRHKIPLNSQWYTWLCATTYNQLFHGNGRPYGMEISPPTFPLHPRHTPSRGDQSKDLKDPPIIEQFWEIVGWTPLSLTALGGHGAEQHLARTYQLYHHDEKAWSQNTDLMVFASIIAQGPAAPYALHLFDANNPKALTWANLLAHSLNIVLIPPTRHDNNDASFDRFWSFVEIRCYANEYVEPVCTYWTRFSMHTRAELPPGFLEDMLPGYPEGDWRINLPNFFKRRPSYMNRTWYSPHGQTLKKAFSVKSACLAMAQVIAFVARGYTGMLLRARGEKLLDLGLAQHAMVIESAGLHFPSGLLAMYRRLNERQRIHVEKLKKVELKQLQRFTELITNPPPMTNHEFLFRPYTPRTSSRIVYQILQEEYNEEYLKLVEANVSLLLNEDALVDNLDVLNTKVSMEQVRKILLRIETRMAGIVRTIFSTVSNKDVVTTMPERTNWEDDEKEANIACADYIKKLHDLLARESDTESELHKWAMSELGNVERDGFLTVEHLKHLLKENHMIYKDPRFLCSEAEYQLIQAYDARSDAYDVTITDKNRLKRMKDLLLSLARKYNLPPLQSNRSFAKADALHKKRLQKLADITKCALYIFETPVSLIDNAQSFVLKRPTRVNPTSEVIQEHCVLLYLRLSYTYGVFWAPGTIEIEKRSEKFDYTKVKLLQTVEEKHAMEYPDTESTFDMIKMRVNLP